MLVFEGIEDGYFWLVRPLLNILWGILVAAVASVWAIMWTVRRMRGT